MLPRFDWPIIITVLTHSRLDNRVVVTVHDESPILSHSDPYRKWAIKMTYLWKTLLEFPTDTLISLRLINILTAPTAVLIYGRNNLSTDEQCGIKSIVCEIVRAVKWRVFLLGLLLTTLLIIYFGQVCVTMHYQLRSAHCCKIELCPRK